MGSPRDLAELLLMLQEGSWRPVIDSVWPLAEIEAALARLEGPAHFGKIVVAV